MSTQLSGETILITGASGQVGGPIAKSLAADNEVWAIGRFSNPDTLADLHEAGVRTAVVDLALNDFSGVPTDVSYALHFARSSTTDWDADLDVNVGGLAALMEFSRNAKALLLCSAGVYAARGARPRFSETDPLGDNMRVMAQLIPEAQTVSITKIATEGAARYCARRFNLPTTIARLNVPYGSGPSWPGGHLERMVAGQPVPVHSDGWTEYNPIHSSDMIATVPGLLAAASVPVTTVNWGGSEIVSIEQWCAYFGELTGIEPTFHRTEQTLPSMSYDTTRMEQLVGKTLMPWKDGCRGIVQSLHPNLLKSTS